MESVQLSKRAKIGDIWKRIEEVRKDAQSMKLLDELIKFHTS